MIDRHRLGTTVRRPRPRVHPSTGSCALNTQTAPVPAQRLRQIATVFCAQQGPCVLDRIISTVCLFLTNDSPGKEYKRFRVASWHGISLRTQSQVPGHTSGCWSPLGRGGPIPIWVPFINVLCTVYCVLSRCFQAMTAANAGMPNKCGDLVDLGPRSGAHPSSGSCCRFRFSLGSMIPQGQSPALLPRRIRTIESKPISSEPSREQTWKSILKHLPALPRSPRKFRSIDFHRSERKNRGKKSTNRLEHERSQPFWLLTGGPLESTGGTRSS